MEIKGKVKKVLPIEQGEGKNGKGWKRRDFILEFKDGDYDKIVALTARTDAALDRVGNLAEGAQVNVSFNVESREYNGKYYTNLNAWKIELLQAATSTDLPF
jgi:hypothetical protein